MLNKASPKSRRAGHYIKVYNKYLWNTFEKYFVFKRIKVPLRPFQRYKRYWQPWYCPIPTVSDFTYFNKSNSREHRTSSDGTLKATDLEYGWQTGSQVALTTKLLATLTDSHWFYELPTSEQFFFVCFVYWSSCTFQNWCYEYS